MEEGTAIPMTFDKCFFDAKKREEEEKLAAAKKREEEEKEAAVQNAKEHKRTYDEASRPGGEEDQFERDKRKELNAYKKRKNK